MGVRTLSDQGLMDLSLPPAAGGEGRSPSPQNFKGRGRSGGRGAKPPSPPAAGGRDRSMSPWAEGVLTPTDPDPHHL